MAEAPGLAGLPETEEEDEEKEEDEEERADSFTKWNTGSSSTDANTMWWSCKEHQLK